MDKHDFHRTNGLTSNSRHLEALHPEFFQVDERTLPQMIKFVLDFSRHVSFTNLHNHPEGNWYRFFEHDLSFILAEIACFDEVGSTTRFFKVSRKAGEVEAEDMQKQLIKELYTQNWELYAQFDQWFKRSKKEVEHLNSNVLEPHLHSVIRSRLSTQFSHLIERTNQLLLYKISLNSELAVPERFDALWFVSKHPLKAQEKANIELEALQAAAVQIHKAIIAAIGHLKFLAPSLLKQSLAEYPYHEPHSSLIISFLDAFSHVKNDLNASTKRHLEYYFRNILKQVNLPPEPDSVHVYFKLAGHVKSVVLPANTVLQAGVDEDGMHTLYATNHPVHLSHSNVDRLLTVHVANNPSIGIGTSLRDVSNIYAAEIIKNEQGFIIDKSKNPIAKFPFGRDQADLSFANRDMQQARVGFAISSPTLLLREGNRNINFTFKFHLKSMTSLVSFVEELAINEKLSADNAFYKILNNVFKVRMTTESGWIETYKYDILRPKTWTDGEVQVSLNLDLSEPALTGYAKDVHGEGYNSDWPVVEFLISSQFAMYGYSYLKDLTLEKCTIDVDVDQVKDLSVFNDQGQLDIQTPFYPFGTSPTLGSYVLLGHNELFIKKLKDVSVDIHWHNLPREKGGFESYYKEYGEEITNDSFKVGLTCLSDFQFQPLDESLIQKFDLFTFDDSNRVLQHKTRLEGVEIDSLKLNPSYSKVDVSAYTTKTRSGFLKLELMQPALGFGFDLFPSLFADAVVKNSQTSLGILGSKDKPKVELPKEAFAPQIRALSVNYKATTTLVFNPNQVSDNDPEAQDTFFHIHPFGVMCTFHRGLPVKNALIGQYEHEGYLYLGFKEMNPPQTIHLYFKLEYNAVNVINYVDIPSVEWMYLEANEWQRFEKNQIVVDGTNNFTTSGIVEIKVPTYIDKQHDVLPSEMFWIAAAVPRNTQILSKIQFIQTNATETVWIPNKKGAEWKGNLPSGAIEGLQRSRTDINLVAQPYQSFGGSLGESDVEFYTRVSDRLKSKNRAVNPEDFERIVLNAFPDIFQVCCLTSTAYPDFVNPGEVKIIVVPKLITAQDFVLPRVDYNRLKVIEDTLMNAVSPFVNVKVINPVYEKVRISCSVQFVQLGNGGELLARLEKDLRRFICSWSRETQTEMILGGSIERSALASFLDSLEYVRFVARLSMVVLHYKNGQYSLSDSAADGGRVNRLESSAPWCVLVPDENHDITLSQRSVHGTPKETKLDTMKVESDFVISEEKEEDLSYPYFDQERDVFYAIQIDLNDGGELNETND